MVPSLILRFVHYVIESIALEVVGRRRNTALWIEFSKARREAVIVLLFAGDNHKGLVRKTWGFSSSLLAYTVYS